MHKHVLWLYFESQGYPIFSLFVIKRMVWKSMGVKLPGDIIVHQGEAFIIIPDLHEDCFHLDELTVVNSNNGNKEKKNH